MNESNQTVKAVKKALPAVISIMASKSLQFFEAMPNPFMPFGMMPPVGRLRRKKVKMGGGSGFIVDKKGIILTNRHVLEDPAAEYVVVLQNGKKFKPEILACDPINDVAVLKIEAPKEKLATVQLGDSVKIELGQTVIAIGNALGLFQNTVSTGVVSGLSREIAAQSGLSQQKTRLRGLIQTDAAINPGNSGGPLIDINGRTIGINAAMVFGAENIGFALPISNAKRDLEELKEYGRIRQPFLGVRYIPINKNLKDRFNLMASSGALVISEPDISGMVKNAVVSGSPADKAGLREADIILEIADKKITEKQSVADILQGCQIGQTMPLKILRRGREKMLKITLAEKQ